MSSVSVCRGASGADRGSRAGGERAAPRSSVPDDPGLGGRVGGVATSICDRVDKVTVVRLPTRPAGRDQRRAPRGFGAEEHVLRDGAVYGASQPVLAWCRGAATRGRRRVVRRGSTPDPSSSSGAGRSAASTASLSRDVAGHARGPRSRRRRRAHGRPGSAPDSPPAAPKAASPAAIPRPMPDPAAVTTATRPSSRTSEGSMRHRRDSGSLIAFARRIGHGVRRLPPAEVPHLRHASRRSEPTASSGWRRRSACSGSSGSTRGSPATSPPVTRSCSTTSG